MYHRVTQLPLSNAKVWYLSTIMRKLILDLICVPFNRDRPKGRT